MREHFTMCFILENEDGKLVQAGQMAMFSISAVRHGIRMKESAVIKEFLKMRRRALFIRN